MVKIIMNKKLDWSKLYFGKVHPDEVAMYTNDPRWQAVRMSMKGKSLEEKYQTLLNYYNAHKIKSRALEVRITNYVTALSRGGLIKPEDYRKE